jgi:hypothetical protein
LRGGRSANANLQQIDYGELMEEEEGRTGKQNAEETTDVVIDEI